MMRRFLNVSSEELRYSLGAFRYWFAGGWRQEKKKVLVNGSPKSGTTWMLRMVENLPGYRGVGNFKGDQSKYWSVLPGQVIHGHDWYTPELAAILAANGIAVVLLVRDPRDQLVSRVFHILRDGEHAWHQRFQALSFDEALLLCIEGAEDLPGTRSMIELAQSWIDAESGALCVRYEDLLRDTAGEFRRVLEYLGLSLPASLVEAIIARNQFERLTNGRKFWKAGRKQGQADPKSHFRKGIVGDWRNHLKPIHVAKFKEVAGDKLIELGYERDTTW